MQIAVAVAVVILAIILLVVVAIWRHSRKYKSDGGNAANTDGELESLYSLLGDNSGRMKK